MSEELPWGWSQGERKYNFLRRDKKRAQKGSRDRVEKFMRDFNSIAKRVSFFVSSKFLEKSEIIFLYFIEKKKLLPIDDEKRKLFLKWKLFLRKHFAFFFASHDFEWICWDFSSCYRCTNNVGGGFHPQKFKILLWTSKSWINKIYCKNNDTVWSWMWVMNQFYRYSITHEFSVREQDNY